MMMSGCEDCADDGEVNNLLTDGEKELIPFIGAATVNFINADSEIISGTYSAKMNKVEDLDISNDEECFATNVERESSTLTLSNTEDGYNIFIRRNRQNELIFIIGNSTDNNLNFAISKCDGFVEDVESSRGNIEIQGFQFTNVYEFGSCSQNSSVDRILYSPENGVEFIEFIDDTYLRLDI